MPMISPVKTALMTAAMMVAMMLPSIAPALWRYHRHLRAMRMARSGERATLFALGYASVWTAIGLALFALPALNVAQWVRGVVILCAAALQLSRWKARQLVRCREACLTAWPLSRNVMTACHDGCRLGGECCLSCAAPMAVLYVAGLMDVRMMLVITAAITGERLAPGGARIARLSGALALIAGLVMSARAL